MPIYKNIANTKILGIKFQTRFLSLGTNPNTGLLSVITSTDGITWTTIAPTPDLSASNGLTFNNNPCMFANSFGYSYNGEKWKESPNQATDTDLEWTSVTNNNSMYVAVGEKVPLGGSTPTNRASYSFDGVNWTFSTTPPSGTIQWSSVTYGTGKFVAVGDGSAGDKRFAYSSDGINWSMASSPLSFKWNSVCFGNGIFVAVSNGVGITNTVFSTNGTSWSPGATQLPAANWRSVCFGNGIFVTVAATTTGNRAYWSNDGSNWSPSLTNPSWSNLWHRVAFQDGIFVILSDDNTTGVASAASSTDGKNWISRTTPPHSTISLV